MSLIVGVACSLYTGPVILEALLLTAVVVISLTAYTFWASKQGHDFRQAVLLSLPCHVGMARKNSGD